MLRDKGYLSTECQLNLFENHQIKFEVPTEVNQKNDKQQPYLLRKLRKRIEILFSQLSDQFMIRRNYTNFFMDLKTRILAIIQFKTLNRNINNLKVNIF